MLLLIDRVLAREVVFAELSAPLAWRPHARNARLVLSAEPRQAHSPVPRHPARGRLLEGFFSPETNAAVAARVAEMAELGYVLRTSGYRSGSLELDFRRDERLVTPEERAAAAPLEFVVAQRAALRAAFPKFATPVRLYPDRAEHYFSETPDQALLLTAKSLGRIPSGRYAFVRLRGENFLRLGTGHPGIGAKEIAVAAGDIELENGQVVFLSPRSDTYRPPDGTLVQAVEALWSQAIYPRPLELREWNNKKILFRQ